MKWLLPATITCTIWLLSAGHWAVAQTGESAVAQFSPAAGSDSAATATEEASSVDSNGAPRVPATDMRSVAEKFDAVLDKFNDATEKFEAAAEQIGDPTHVHAEVATTTDVELADEILPMPIDNEVVADPDTETAPDQEGISRQTAVIASLTIFALAVFVGFEVITKVPPTLHTPLMSGSNAISGITVVGALLAAGAGTPGELGFPEFLGMLAVVMAMVNVVGGFMVTDRMLGMFRRR